MTKRQKEVRDLIAKWKPVMLLDHWNISYSIMSFNKQGDEKVMAEIGIRPRYMEAHIEVYPFFWDADEAKDPKYRSATIAHELAHIIACPTVELAFKLINGELVTGDHVNATKEVLTEHIARIAVRLSE